MREGILVLALFFSVCVISTTQANEFEWVENEELAQPTPPEDSEKPFVQSIKTSKRCVDSKTLEVCLDGNCTTAPCLEDHFCITPDEDGLITRAPLCMIPDSVASDCEDDKTIRYSLVFGEDEVEINEVCPETIGFCLQGTCQTPDSSVASR